MTTNWKALCFELAEALMEGPVNARHGDLLRRVREGAGLTGVDTPLQVLGLPKELYNPLRRAGYHTVEMVQAAGPELLMRVNMLGPERVGQTLAAVRKWRSAAKG